MARVTHINKPREKQPSPPPEFRPADLDSAQRTENDPSIQKYRGIVNEQLLVNQDPFVRSNFSLSKLNNAVMFNPYLGDLLEKGRKAQRTRTRAL